MKTKKAIPIFLCIATVLAAVLMFYSSGEKVWQTETLHEEDSSFIQLEIINGQPNIAFSTDNGIRLMKRKSTGLFSSGTEWVTKNITERENSGYYLSMEKIDGELAMAHQYSRLGDRKLGYTHQVNGSWKTDKVDSVTGSGLEAGMYASLSHINGDPVILYHTAENDQFLKARKINGSWEREILDTNTGQFISTDSCGEKIFVVYRSRENSTVNRGVLSSSGWETRKLPGDTDAAMAVDATNCRFRAAYHNTETGQITYVKGENIEEIAQGKLSRVSLEYQKKPHISYYRSGEGLFYTTRKETSWKNQLIDGEREYAGERNQIDLFSNGDPGVVYTAGPDIIYTEYTAKNGSKMNRTVKLLIMAAFLSAALAAIYLEEELMVLKSKLFKQF